MSLTTPPKQPTEPTPPTQSTEPTQPTQTTEPIQPTPSTQPAPSSSTELRRPPLAARRTGYLVSVLVNVLMLFGVNVWPGWEAVPFLTADMTLVIGLVNASIIVGIVANVVYLVRDSRWVRAIGDIATNSVGLAAMVRLYQVSPFDFSGSTFEWIRVVQILLFVGIAGALIGIIVAIVSLVRSAMDAARD